MDKYEYKIKAEEIETLARNKQYVEALAIVDTIDWRRVKSVMMLNVVGEIYKINKRYEECKGILLLANERHPQSRFNIYSLCEICTKLGQFVEAVEYYKEFVRIAPNDLNRYVLKYRIYEAQDVSLEERIEVLEEFMQKEKNPYEKWCYELAYLYHKSGLGTKCVEECDSLSLMFGTGKYVIKALELKMLHEPLTPSQQAQYDQNKERIRRKRQRQEEKEREAIQEQEEIQEQVGQEQIAYEELPREEYDIQEGIVEEEIQVKQVDVSIYNTTNLQQELAASMQELMVAEEEQDGQDAIVEAIVAPLLQDTVEIRREDGSQTHEEEVFFQEDEEEITEEELYAEEEVVVEELYTEEEEVVVEELYTEEEEIAEELYMEEEDDDYPITNTTPIKVHGALPGESYANVLVQEYDGQISLAVPEGEQVERQITGQLSITDILIEWEQMKRENEEKRKEENRQRVLQHTSDMFSEYDAATKVDLLAELNELANEVDPYEEEMKQYEEMATEEVEQQIEEVEETIEEVEETIEGIKEEIEENEEVEEAVEEIKEEIEENEEVEETVEEIKEEIEESEEVEETVEEIKEEIEESKEVEETEEALAEVEEEEGIVGELSTLDGVSQQQVVASLLNDGKLSKEQRKLFGPFIKVPKCRDQILETLDRLTLAAYTGNVIITGESPDQNFTLATNLIREVKLSDGNFSGKVARISANKLNHKEVDIVIKKLNNGALIIDHAQKLSMQTVTKMLSYMEQEEVGIIVVLQGVKHDIEKLLKKRKDILNTFNLRVDIDQADNDSLVKYAVQYAYDKEYAIDEFGLLALHTCIAQVQTNSHQVTMKEVERIINDAIEHANKKTIAHFMDIILRKRYDKEDMILLQENDFIIK